MEAIATCDACGGRIAEDEDYKRDEARLGDGTVECVYWLCAACVAEDAAAKQAPTTPVERVLAFLDARATMGDNVDPTIIHSVVVGPDAIRYDLRTADVRAVAAQARATAFTQADLTTLAYALRTVADEGDEPEAEALCARIQAVLTALEILDGP